MGTAGAGAGGITSDSTNGNAGGAGGVSAFGTVVKVQLPAAVVVAVERLPQPVTRLLRWGRFPAVVVVAAVGGRQGTQDLPVVGLLVVVVVVVAFLQPLRPLRAVVVVHRPN